MMFSRCVARGVAIGQPLRTSLTYHSKNKYRGPVNAIILDWSGTTADNWVIAPAVAFVDAFKKEGVDITMEEARKPMGLRKDLHIKKLTEMPEIRAKWHKVHGRYPNDTDVDRMFKNFVPIQLKCLPRYTALIPGTVEAVNTIRKEHPNIKIGMTTGFQRSMVEVLLKAAEKQGFVPDLAVAGDDVHHPRPYPYMVFKNLEKLAISPVHSVIKVDDTASGVGEGLNAGCWTVGLSHTSNYMNINTPEEGKSMSKEEFERRGELSAKILRDAGAHYVVRDITKLPMVVNEIQQRLKAGETP